MSRQRVPNPELASDTARLNLLVNGGMNIAQRGNGPFTAQSAYTADRWIITLAGSSTLTVNAGQVVLAGIGGSAVNGVTGSVTIVGGATVYLGQAIKFPELNQLRGATISLSMRVMANTANALRLRLFADGTGGPVAFSAYHGGGSVWQTLTVTITVPTDATQISVNIVFDNTASVWQAAMAMLVQGSVPADFAPMHPADDLARCLRYYEATSQVAAAWIIRGVANATSQRFSIPVTYKAVKAVVPTVTKVGSWTVAGPGGQPVIGGIGQDVCDLYADSTGAGQLTVYGGAGQYITIEANP